MWQKVKNKIAKERQRKRVNWKIIKFCVFVNPGRQRACLFKNLFSMKNYTVQSIFYGGFRSVEICEIFITVQKI